VFKNILVPTDGSEFSEKVAQPAMAFAKAFNGKITGIHVFPPSFGVYYGEAVWVDDRMQSQMRETAEAEGNKYLDRLQAAAATAQIPFERVLQEGASPWRGIVETAESRGCDLIMMAAHGRRGLSALVLGSETNRVLTHSKVPVLVYR
jgi:nucleotide-binding universal stress UspA family protein